MKEKCANFQSTFWGEQGAKQGDAEHGTPGGMLANEDFKSGHGIPFIALDGDGPDAKFLLRDEAKEFLQTIKAPVALAAIVGKYRTGKSLLVNRMLLDIQGGGFPVGATVNSCTKGLWMWNKPLLCTREDGTAVQLLLIDTEGLGSLDADRDHDAKIFSLALLLSSFFIYNSVGSIDESALNELSLVVELTKHIKTKSEEEGVGEQETGENFADYFPSLLWVVRDFTLQLVDESQAPITAKGYLERALSVSEQHCYSDEGHAKNRIRRTLAAFFPQRDCVTLVRPVEDESLLQHLDEASWEAFRPEFVKQVRQLRLKIFGGAPVKKVNDKEVDGFMLASLAQGYATSINSGDALNIGDTWRQVSQFRNVKAKEDALASYEAAASALDQLLPLSAHDLDAKQADMVSKSEKEFKNDSMGSGQDVDSYRADMMQGIQASFAKLRVKNERVAREKAQAALDELFAGLKQEVMTHKVESFAEFDAVRKLRREDYLNAVPETPAKATTLLTFMETLLVDAALQIEADCQHAWEEQLAVVQGQRDSATHALDLEKKRAAASVEEATTHLTQVQQLLQESQQRSLSLQTEMEEMTTRHRRQLAEETGELQQALTMAKDGQASQEHTHREALREAAAQASQVQQELGTQVALLQEQQRLDSEEKRGLRQRAEALAAQVAAAAQQGEEMHSLRQQLTSLQIKYDCLESERQGVQDGCLEEPRKLDEAISHPSGKLSASSHLASASREAASGTQAQPGQVLNLDGAPCVRGLHDTLPRSHTPPVEELPLVQALKQELFDTKTSMVDLQAKCLQKAEHVQSLQKQLGEAKFVLEQQQAQLQAVTDVNLFCLQKAATVQGLHQALAKLAEDKASLERERDAAVADAEELAQQLELLQDHNHEEAACGSNLSSHSTRLHSPRAEHRQT